MRYLKCVVMRQENNAEKAAPLVGRGFEFGGTFLPSWKERYTAASVGSKVAAPVLASFSVFAIAMK